jgi:hypothetical protein
VKRFLALLLGGLGLGALLRRRRRRNTEPEYSPADELKARLAETRAAEEEPVLEADLEARRRDVHDRARGAIDDLS